MKLTTLFLALVVATGSAWADSKVFKCVTEDGDPAVDISVDLENKVLNFGSLEYRIHHINSQFVSAYMNPINNAVGGEVLVFDRLNGEYHRATVFTVWPRPEDIQKKPGKLVSVNYKGRCNKPLL